jgi:1-acyl-sn-glycerol-3-phosphate acyltransferase
MLPSSRLALAFVWGVAEATFWPIMPDAVLVPLSARRPGSWWGLALAAAAGSSVGGALDYGVGRMVPTRTLLARLPFVRPAMVAAADRWLSTEGAVALRHQPLSGVPFKVFALQAGSRHAPFVPFVLCALIARGARFLAVTSLAALLGRRFEPLVQRHPRPLLVLWIAVVTLGLWRMLVTWERRARTANNLTSALPAG